MKKIVKSVVAACLLAGAGVALWFCLAPAEEPAPEPHTVSAEPAPRRKPAPASRRAALRPASAEPAVAADAEAAPAGTAAPAETAEERQEREEEALVEAFDGLTDKWMEPTARVTMEDVRRFGEAFRRVPKARQDECIHRALNLVPDENVMLLAGILMDKTQDREIVETVYNDILNRDEDVKKPILQQIFKDRSHPCWADTAWILDVTGERPVSGKP